MILTDAAALLAANPARRGKREVWKLGDYLQQPAGEPLMKVTSARPGKPGSVGPYSPTVEDSAATDFAVW